MVSVNGILQLMPLAFAAVAMDVLSDYRYLLTRMIDRERDGGAIAMVAPGLMLLCHDSYADGQWDPERRRPGPVGGQIAERLFLSHCTVASHLHRVYPKLGLASRTALRVALDAIARGETPS